MMGTVGTRSALIVVLDGDGDQDIVTNEFNGAPQILAAGQTLDIVEPSAP